MSNERAKQKTYNVYQIFEGRTISTNVKCIFSKVAFAQN